jgi:hypothetical protein
LALEGGRRSDYDPSLAATVVNEAAGLLKAIGLASHHLILIGGIVPSLLVPVLDPEVEPHIGTTDLDLCLSLSIVEGDTAEYERIEQGLKRAGYTPDESWRWRGGPGGRLVVEFFCPASPERPPGRIFRPRRDEHPMAKQNLGGKLAAFALDAGHLISSDVRVVEREVVLPGGRGTQIVDLRITGPAAFIAAKVAALRGRDKPKDAYDIVWLVEAWPDGPRGAARSVRQSPIFDHEDMRRAIGVLEDQFRDIDRAGARAYARFMNEPDMEADVLARHAVGAVGQFLDEVRRAQRDA